MRIGDWSSDVCSSDLGPRRRWRSRRPARACALRPQPGTAPARGCPVRRPAPPPMRPRPGPARGSARIPRTPAATRRPCRRNGHRAGTGRGAGRLAWGGAGVGGTSILNAGGVILGSYPWRKTWMATRSGGSRMEHDSMGELKVPADALWGAQTQRAVENFPISGRPMPRGFIRALGLVKAAAAEVNAGLGILPKVRAAAIRKAAMEVAAGSHRAHFPIDVYQTGSGTSSHTKANEVIATLASPIRKASCRERERQDL